METIDDLLIEGLKLIQKKEGFRFTLDSVLLAQFATLKEGDRVVDIGTGTGIIPHILSARGKKIRVTGIELLPEMAEMAARSVLMNGLEETIEILEGDLRNIHKRLGGGTYTLVTANPPYSSVRQGQTSTLPGRAVARHELTCGLEDVVSCAAKLLNYQGRFALIQRADRLPELFDLLQKYMLKPRRLRCIHAFADRPAQHVLLEARKNAAADLKVLPPLIVYREQGRYSEEILRWYGKGSGGSEEVGEGGGGNNGD